MKSRIDEQADRMPSLERRSDTHPLGADPRSAGWPFGALSDRPWNRWCSDFVREPSAPLYFLPPTPGRGPTSCTDLLNQSLVTSARPGRPF
jgi:hypothetical protein